MESRRVLLSNTALIVTLLWLVTSACHSWQPLQVQQPSPSQMEAVDHVRVTLKDGSIQELRGDIRIVGDSLVGEHEQSLAYNQTRTEVNSVAVGDIAKIEERKSKPLLTGLAVVGGIFGAASLLCLASGCYEFELDFANGGAR